MAKKQIDRFREAAHEVGADESDDALDRIFGRLDLRKRPEAPAGLQQTPLAVEVEGLTLGPRRLLAETFENELVDLGLALRYHRGSDLGESSDLSSTSRAVDNVIVLGRVVAINR